MPSEALVEQIDDAVAPYGTITTSSRDNKALESPDQIEKHGAEETSEIDPFSGIPSLVHIHHHCCGCDGNTKPAKRDDDSESTISHDEEMDMIVDHADAEDEADAAWKTWSCFALSGSILLDWNNLCSTINTTSKGIPPTIGIARPIQSSIEIDNHYDKLEQQQSNETTLIFKNLSVLFDDAEASVERRRTKTQFLELEVEPRPGVTQAADNTVTTTTELENIAGKKENGLQEEEKNGVVVIPLPSRSFHEDEKNGVVVISLPSLSESHVKDIRDSLLKEDKDNAFSPDISLPSPRQGDTEVTPESRNTDAEKERICHHNQGETLEGETLPSNDVFGPELEVDSIEAVVHCQVRFQNIATGNFCDVPPDACVESKTSTTHDAEPGQEVQSIEQKEIASDERDNETSIQAVVNCPVKLQHIAAGSFCKIKPFTLVESKKSTIHDAEQGQEGQGIEQQEIAPDERGGETSIEAVVDCPVILENIAAGSFCKITPDAIEDSKTSATHDAEQGPEDQRTEQQVINETRIQAVLNCPVILQSGATESFCKITPDALVESKTSTTHDAEQGQEYQGIEQQEINETSIQAVVNCPVRWQHIATGSFCEITPDALAESKKSTTHDTEQGKEGQRIEQQEIAPDKRKGETSIEAVVDCPVILQNFATGSYCKITSDVIEDSKTSTGPEDQGIEQQEINETSIQAVLNFPGILQNVGIESFCKISPDALVESKTSTTHDAEHQGIEQQEIAPDKKVDETSIQAVVDCPVRLQNIATGSFCEITPDVIVDSKASTTHDAEQGPEDQGIEHQVINETSIPAVLNFPVTLQNVATESFCEITPDAPVESRTSTTHDAKQDQGIEQQEIAPDDKVDKTSIQAVVDCPVRLQNIATGSFCEIAPDVNMESKTSTSHDAEQGQVDQGIKQQEINETGIQAVVNCPVTSQNIATENFCKFSPDALVESKNTTTHDVEQGEKDQGIEQLEIAPDERDNETNIKAVVNRPVKFQHSATGSFCKIAPDAIVEFKTSTTHDAEEDQGIELQEKAPDGRGNESLFVLDEAQPRISATTTPTPKNEMGMGDDLNKHGILASQVCESIGKGCKYDDQHDGGSIEPDVDDIISIKSATEESDMVPSTKVCDSIDECGECDDQDDGGSIDPDIDEIISIKSAAGEGNKTSYTAEINCPKSQLMMVSLYVGKFDPIVPSP